jgi:DNA processing protein
MAAHYYGDESIHYEFDGSDSFGDWDYGMQSADPFSGESRSMSDYTQYAVEHLEELGVEHENYPDQYKSFWGERLPRKLYCLGNSSLLNEKSVMVCGSREVSQKGLDIAYKCGRLIADMGYTLASGYARGVDMAAHKGALEAGGKTIAILPYGLGKFKRHVELAGLLDFDNFLAVSELPLSYPFSAGSALRRNKLLVALSRAVIVVESKDKGGTWYSAKYAGRKEKPLYFFEGGRADVAPKLKSIGGERLQIVKNAPQLRKIDMLIKKQL